MKKSVYLDNAATTPLLPEVIELMNDIMKNQFGNPSSIHEEGRKARAIIEDARKTVARAIGASIGEIFFTSGGTESNNWALKGAVRDLGIKRIISSPTEHHCVLHSLQSIEAHYDVTLIFLHTDQLGHIDYTQLEDLLADSTVPTLVSLMHANNEMGTLHDIERVGQLCHQYGALFHSDTVQTIGHYPLDVQDLYITFLSGSAHKFHGPKGVGFLYINSNHFIKPYIDGGSQERNMRGGTENIYGIAGMAKALELAMDQLDSRRAHIESLRCYFVQKLTDTFGDIQFNGDWENGLYTVLNVSFPPSDRSDLLLILLDIAGIRASGGSACSSGAETHSHVLQAIQADPARKAVRFSFSHFNTAGEIDYVVEQLKTIFSQKATV